MAVEDERLGKLLNSLCDVMRVAHDRGLVNVLGGNASFRWGEGFYITPSQVPKHTLRPEDIVYVPFKSGPGLSLNGRKASMEWRMHGEIYSRRDDVKAILHVHNPRTVAIYSLGLEVSFRNYVEGESIDCVSKVKRFPEGSVKLAKAVGEAVGKCNAIVLLNHGIVVAGKTLYQVLDMAEALEDLSSVTLIELFVKGLRKIM